MKISVLIPYKPDNGSRDYIWSYIKGRYEKLFPELELCFSIDNCEPFCKARAVNKAAKKASGDVFIICDADIIFEAELIDKVRQEIPNHPWIQPFNTCYKLSKEATEQLVTSGNYDKIQIRPEDGKKIRFYEDGGLIKFDGMIAGPYINVVTRECFEAVSGFDERFKAWGYQDLTFAYALDVICGPHHQISATIYHLWHQRYADMASSQFKNNLALYERYKGAGLIGQDELKKVIAERFEKINECLSSI